MQMAMLSGNSEELRRILLENGLIYISIRPALRSLLCEYISRSLPGRRVICVEKTGWHNEVYVLPDEVISPGCDSVILQGSHYLTGGFAQSGMQVAALCTGNSRLVFALLAVAGEMATLHGITGWSEGTAYEAVQLCLHAWLNEHGHIANQGDGGVLAQIKRFITAHQYSRFASGMARTTR